MNPTEEWARAEAVNVVAAIRGLGKDPVDWTVANLDQLEPLARAVKSLLPDAHVVMKNQVIGGQRLTPAWLTISGFLAPSPDEPKRIRWREFL